MTGTVGKLPFEVSHRDDRFWPIADCRLWRASIRESEVGASASRWAAAVPFREFLGLSNAASRRSRQIVGTMKHSQSLAKAPLLKWQLQAKWRTFERHLSWF